MFLFHSVVIPFSFMKCNYISTKAMSAEGACQKAVSLPWSCCAARCRIHWFSEDHEVSHFAQFSTSGWSHTCRHQHSQSAKVAAHKIRVELPSTRATYIIRLENSTEEWELLFPQQITPDLLQPPERQDCTNMSKQRKSFAIPGFLWNKSGVLQCLFNDSGFAIFYHLPH